MSDSFVPLIAAAIAFVGGHLFVSHPPVRAGLIGKIGENAFLGAYAAAAAALLALFGIAYGRAPQVALWPVAAWMRNIPAIVMPLAVLLIVCGASQLNPTAVRQGFARGDAPPAPGILAVTRHPTMWGIGLWAVAHILPNGDVASLILFGGIAFLALYGTTRLDAKAAARDPQGFARFAHATSNLPFAAMLAGRARLNFAGVGVWRLAIAAMLYLVLAAAHPWIAGVPAY